MIVINSFLFGLKLFSGDLDMALPYLSTTSIIKSLNLKLEKIWHPWFVEGEVAG